MKKFSILLLLFILCSGILPAQTEYPVLKTYATDETGTLSNGELSQINNALKVFDDSTSNQIVFLMVPSLNGDALESYTYEVASRNKVGSKKNDNGVLFFVAKDDHKMRIEVGYGLEGALPDALCSSILRNEVRPYFKRDDYYSGIAAGLNAIMAATRGEYTNDRKPDEDKGHHGIPFFLIIIILIFLFGRGRRGGGLGSLLLLGALGSGGRSRSNWGGGGFGGGGFGGFSGGGGGFGGGGASGGW